MMSTTSNVLLAIGPPAPNARVERNGAAADARDQFAALLPAYEGVLGPEHPETLAVWYQLAHWTALAGDEAATQD